VWYSKIFEKINLSGWGVDKFIKIMLSCHHAITERNRLQKQKLWGIFPGQRGPQNHFLTAAAMGAT
jgi:hypothetical protein